MKKLLLFAFFLYVGAISNHVSCQNSYQVGIRVYLDVHLAGGNDHGGNIGISYPKSPVQPPEVYLDGYTLYIASSHADYTLVVEDTDETEVYQTSVPSSVSTVVLPSSLSGTYILKLETDTFVFEGEIEL